MIWTKGSIVKTTEEKGRCKVSAKKIQTCEQHPVTLDQRGED